MGDYDDWPNRFDGDGVLVTGNENWDDVRSLIRYGEIGWNDERLFYLPHQCDEWEIGDLAQFRAFIDACEEAYAVIKEREQNDA